MLGGTGIQVLTPYQESSYQSHTPEKERWIRFLNSSEAFLSIFQPTFPHQTGHRSSNKESRTGRAIQRDKGSNEEGRRSEAALQPDYKSLPKAGRKKRTSWALQRVGSTACSSPQLLKEGRKGKSPSAEPVCATSTLPARWRTAIRFWKMRFWNPWRRKCTERCLLNQGYMLFSASHKVFSRERSEGTFWDKEDKYFFLKMLLLGCWPLLDRHWHSVAASLRAHLFVSRKSCYCFGWSGNSEQNHFCCL